MRRKTITLMASIIMAFTYYLLDFTVDSLIKDLPISQYAFISAIMKTGYIIIFSVIVVELVKPEVSRKTLYLLSLIFFILYLIITIFFIWL